jgi:signal transduction histidine kinase
MVSSGRGLSLSFGAMILVLALVFLTAVWTLCPGALLPLSLLTVGGVILVEGGVMLMSHRVAADRALMQEELEGQVQARTDELEKIYQELMNAEKLAALGHLAAGMAHDLNTPLGAIQAANRLNIEFLTGAFVDRLHTLLTFDDEERDLFFRLVGSHRALSLTLPPAPDRTRRRELLKNLTERGLSVDEDLADYLLELKLETDVMDRLVARPDLTAILQNALDLLVLARMNRVIAEAAEKAAHVVDALRRYLKGTGESMERFNVTEQLETMLTLFQHTIKRGVRVTRSFGEGIEVFGDRQKLNQVWMNLIRNALEAMRYKGTLALAAERSAGQIIVSVTDNGPGIPGEVRDRVFQPYFTTKVQGEGLGIGLDLCRKIVESHRGTIGFESRPGNTVFTVTLPTPQES